MSSKVMRVISMALLGYLVIMTATAVFGALVDDGVMFEAWYAMLDYIPFGSFFGPLCIKLFADSFNLGNNMAGYLTGIKDFNMLNLFEDICLLVLTAVFFEAVNNGIQVLVDVKNKKGIYNILMKMISGMVSVLLCTFIAAFVMNFLYRQMEQLPTSLQGIIATIVSIITIGGAFGVMYFVLGVGILGAIAFVAIKMLLINILKVTATYIGILLIILFIGEEAYAKVFTVFAGWGVVIVLLIGVDILISSLFEH